MSKYPRVVSLHFTNRCNLSCPFCYVNTIEVKPTIFWLKLVHILGDMGIEQVAIGGGEPFLFPAFLKDFCKLCAAYGIVTSITSNATLIIPESLEKLETAMISLSIDEHKLQHNSLEHYMKTLRMISSYGIETGINYLITSNKYFKELSTIMEHLDEYVDNYHILQLKQVPNPVSVKLLQLLKVFAIKSKKIYVDDSIALDINIREKCRHGSELISIHPDGSVSPCSFSSPIGKLEKPSDLVNIVEKYYSMNGYNKCPYVNRRKCD